jgi:hypothetical protein
MMTLCPATPRKASLADEVIGACEMGMRHIFVLGILPTIQPIGTIPWY